MKKRDSMKTASEDPAVAEELERLKALFAADPAALELNQRLFERAAFLSVSLQRLEVFLIRDGFTELYSNGGGQQGRKKTPESDLYISFQKLFLATMKQLKDALGECLRREPDELEQFFLDRWKKDKDADIPEEMKNKFAGYDEFELF